MADSRRELRILLEKLYHERGLDFREYKETTLTRRLNRRLRARGVKTYSDYARVLDRDTTEYDKLFDDLTINVTSFFRDEVAFRALKEVALPALINRGMNTGKILRIWSAGCATGEEPYSIAMILLETLQEKISQWEVTILATDIDNKALDRARDGFFTPNEVIGVLPAWLEKYFVHKIGGFHVKPALRQLVTFESHNLVSDQPYHDLDLIVCRNVLIYFEPALQIRVLKGFRDGLREGGFLLLGKSELPTGDTTALFYCLDIKAKLFKKV